MNTAEKLITENLDVWTSAVKARSSAGRGASKKRELYGIQKLRELILQLAVRGLLVPQDPNDEPASDLLKRISTEKAKLAKSGEIRKQKPSPPPENTQTPFEIPNGWQWASLGALVYPEMGQSPPSKFYNQDRQGLPFFQGKADFGAKYPEPRYWCVQPSKLAYPNDVLLSVRAPVGPTNISNIDCCIGRGLAALRPLCGVHSNFINYLMKAFRPTLESLATGTTFSAVSKTNVETLAVTVPPLAEQHRIVAKVDELMALCDQLEQEQTRSLETHDTLVATLLGALTTATADASQFAEAWQRIQANFDTLFTSESSIDQLKQTILQLAVMGKLEDQRPDVTTARSDFPKWQKNSTRNEAGEVPSNWLILPLGRLGEWKGGGTPSKSNSTYWDGPIPWVCPKDMKRPLISESILQITKEAVSETSVKEIPPNSLLMVVRGMILARDFPVAISGDLVTVNQDMKALIPTYEGTVQFIHLALRALCPTVLEVVERSSHGTCKLQTQSLHTLPIPIPPQEEQHRIVAKVDELMALCDQLKASLATAQATQLNLADSLVGQAIQ